MDWQLDPAELRVLGALMEKEIATPEYYPLSLNALVNACNQKSNRDPMLDVSEKDVQFVAVNAAEEDSIIAFYNLAPPEVAKWAAGMQRPQPAAPMLDPAHLTDGYENIPRSYIHCTRDQANMPALQRRMIKDQSASPVIELETDHVPQLSAPDELVRAIDELAREEVPA